jgi:transcriptional regulator with XRE-family HTH domain
MSSSLHINSRQIKAGRALIDWSQEDLAEATNLAVATIRKIESGHLSPRHSTMTAIKDVLEKQKIEFTPSSGMRLRDNDIMTIEGEDSYFQLLEDIAHTFRNKSGEVLFLYADSSVSNPDELVATNRLRKMGIKWRLISAEDNSYFHYPLDNYRLIPKQFFKRNIQLIYDNKVALATEVDHPTNITKKIIVIESPAVAEAHRHLFNFIWESCRKPTFTTAPVVYE